MKKIVCLLLSFTLIFSVDMVNVAAAEDTDSEFGNTKNSEEDSFETRLDVEDGTAGTSITTDEDSNSSSNSSEDENIPEGEISEEKEGLTETRDQQESDSSAAEENPDEKTDDVTDFVEDELTVLSGGVEDWPVASLELSYDDRYSLTELKEISGSNESYVIYQIDNTPTSYQVEKESATAKLDTSVVSQVSKDGLDIMASGVGTATILLVPESQKDVADPSDIENGGIQVQVTVKPATLTMMYLTGQSNMEGRVSTSTGYELNASVACEEGTVYSTYAPTNSNSDQIAGRTFSSYCSASNASDFVAESLQSSTSVSGKNLTYTLDSLTTGGSGKAGPDSGLAYEWNKLTGDKVWVVNTAWSGTGIASWIPSGTQYKRSAAVWEYVDQVYEAELSAGHYTEGSKLAFWLQGESDTTAQTATEDYTTNFTSMYTSMKTELGLDAFGIIMVRGSGTGDSTSGAYTTDKDLKMSNPRIAQYMLGGSSGLSDVYVVSNANEQWVSDSGVKSYFKSAYPGGKLDYPMQGSTKTSLPTTVNAVHSDIHYSQIGHNENGITAADGMYQVLYGSTTPKSVSWKDEDGSSISSMTLLVTGDTAVAVPVADPVYSAKKVTSSVSGSGISYNSQIGLVTAKSTGSYKLVASYEGKSSELTVKVSVPKDLSSVAGSNYTGLYKYNGYWWYLKNGVIQRDYESVVKNENGWWYVKDGMVDFDYTGFAENSNGWWYIESGKVTFNKNSVIKDNDKKVDGTASWWYVVGSKVQLSFTGLADYSNSNGWWYINNGKVTFDVNTVAKNKNGWYYVKDSKVIFSYNGFAQNKNGWWYIEKGKVTFKKNSVIKDTNKAIDGKASWWYVDGSKVQTGYTGVANYKNENGWWYVKNGKVDFSANTVAKNKNGWWYVLGGKVQFGFTGLADYKNSNGWWYIKNGKVDFTASTVAKNKNGWWYVKNGKVNFSFNGIAQNKNGWWYIKNGKVNFSYTGSISTSGRKYQVINGKVKR